MASIKYNGVYTPLRILNAHGNVAFALVNRLIMGDLIVQMCKINVSRSQPYSYYLQAY